MQCPVLFSQLLHDYILAKIKVVVSEFVASFLDASCPNC
jgi:hypothetical protein